jgi:polysaccharide pyruvyl transferase WcaK-like protein
MKRISVTGFYGMKNYGDDIFNLSMIYGFDPKFDKVKILAPCLTVEDPKTIKQNFLPSWFKLFWHKHNRVSGFIRTMIKMFYCCYSDVYVIGGGSLFSNVSKSEILQFKLCKLFNTKIWALGVSVGPFSNSSNEFIVKEQLNRMAKIRLRDLPSYEWVKRNCSIQNCKLSFDLAPSYFVNSNQAIAIDKQDTIGLSLCNDYNYPSDFSREKSIEFQKYAIEYALKKKLSISLFILNNHPDVGDGKKTQYFIS